MRKRLPEALVSEEFLVMSQANELAREDAVPFVQAEFKKFNQRKDEKSAVNHQRRYDE